MQAQSLHVLKRLLSLPGLLKLGKDHTARGTRQMRGAINR